LRVAQPAHFGAYEVFAARQEISLLPWTVEFSARLPRRYARERLL
jgi:hypothetical protein